MKIYVKNMITNHCKALLKLELEKIGMEFKMIGLGEVELAEKPSELKYEELKEACNKCGFELLNNTKTILVQRIKILIIEMVHFTNEFPSMNYSYYISQKLLHDYTYLSNIFSEIENITIEHFIISQKIEKAKELLISGENNISEIARKLNYSSISHLSNQFKKVTGFTPTFFKAMKNKNKCS